MPSILRVFLWLCACWTGLAGADSRTLAVSRPAAASGEHRVALVIGNAAYPALPLANPANDAHDVAEALRKTGFDVAEKINVAQKEMNRAIAQFGSRLRKDSVALFYYAGHGIQVRGKNYLIPVDAQIDSESAVRAEAVDVDTLLDQLAESRINIVILDACRNNPFERRFRSLGGGLAQMDAPKGTLIAYATAPGKVAADGRGRNGIYTQELLKLLQTPGLAVEQIFKRVRIGVSQATNDNQIPWESSSLTGDFYFMPGPPAASVPPVASIQALPSAALPAPSFTSNRQEQRVPGTEFRDCPECPEMIVVPAGSFDMGSPSYEEGRIANEEPIHRVSVPSFAIGKYEVTRGQFAAFVAETNRDMRGCYIFGNNVPNRNWRDPGFRQDDRHPVVCVNWQDASAYAEWLARKTGEPYRLLSESEWEYAARAGSHTTYYWGDDAALACRYGNVLDALGIQIVGINPLAKPHDCDDGADFTAPVGGYQPNRFGLFDMIGNVFEWTADCWVGSYQGAPSDGSAWLNGDCTVHVIRGGSWSDDNRFARAARRVGITTESRDHAIGFRVGRSLR